jgi:hypothetical protein
MEDVLGNSRTELQCRTLTFDGWAHQGDSLRRALLLQAIEAVCTGEPGWLPEERRTEWANKLKELRGTREDTQTETTPLLRRYGKWLLISTLLVPVGLALISPTFKDLPGGEILWRVLALALALAPLIVWFSIWWISHADLIGNVEVGADDITHILARTSKTTTTTRNTKSGQPGTLEFHDTWSELLNETLTEQRRLVLVVDNLDRMNHGEARELWATMRLFFEFGRPRPAWANRFWLVVPFDDEAARALWEQQPAKAEIGESAGTLPDGPGDLGRASLDKSFQAVFYLPPLRVTGLQSYLKSRLCDAMPEHPQEDFHQVYRVFQTLRLADTAPTPREIKLFINDIGATHRIWADEIPLAAQAVYAQLRRRGTPSVDSILLGEHQALLDLASLASGVQLLDEWLAALHLCATREQAMQTVMVRPISDAITGTRRVDLSRWSKLEGFPEVCEDVVVARRDSLATSGDVLVTAIANLSDCVVPPSDAWTGVWRMVLDQASHLESWPLGSADLHDAIKALTERLDGDQYSVLVKQWGQSAAQVVTVASEPEDEPELDANAAGSWLAGAQTIALDGLPDGLDAEMRVALPNELFIDLIDAAQGEFEIPWGVVLPASAQAVGLDLVSRIEAEEGGVLGGEVLITAYRLAAEGTRKTILDACRERLGELEADSDESLALLQMVFGTLDGSYSLQIAGALRDDGVLEHLMTQEDDATASLAVALLTIVGIPKDEPSEHGGALTTRQTLNDVKQRPPVTRAVLLTALEHVLDAGQLEVAITTSAATPAGRRLCAAMMNVSSAPELISKAISAEILAGAAQPVGEYLVDPVLDGVVASYPVAQLTDALPPSSARGFHFRVATMLMAQGRSSENLAAKVCTWLTAITDTEWLRQLRTSGPSLRLLRAAQSAEVGLALELPLRDAILSHARALLAGTSPQPRPVEGWAAILTTLDPSLERNLRLDLVDLACSVTTKKADLEALLSAYGSVIVEQTSDSHSADNIERKLLPQILRRSKLAELVWAAELAETHREELQGAPAAARAELQLRIAEAEARLERNPRLLKQVTRLRVALQ